MRCAAYLRVSTAEQVESFSLDAQMRAIETWVQDQGGTICGVYVEEGASGRTLDRPEFRRLRRDARKRKFDAVVVHKFDRFARNRTDALAIKSLLRHDYGIKVFSVSEPSEDSDGPMGALIEGIMESVADWYSQNLAAEVAKGKKERSHQGLHNNRAPFGLKKGPNKVLIADENELPGLQLAFTEYATGRYSDTDIAHLLNNAGFRSKTGRRFSKDTVRDILQNRTYLGQIKYQKYSRRSNGARSFDAPVHWTNGQHDGVIDPELFARCQQVRKRRAAHYQSTAHFNFYLLRDMVYCDHCRANEPAEKTVRKFGKMRAQGRSDRPLRYYRCRARELGYDCQQPGVQVGVIDDQVVALLKSVEPPPIWRGGVANAMGQLLGDRKLEARLAEIKDIIRRMDMRWDNGFITNEQAYMEKRLGLQNELEKLDPLPDDDLQQAADLLQNFAAHWERLSGQLEAQRALLQLIIQRVYVREQSVSRLVFRDGSHLVLD